MTEKTEQTEPKELARQARLVIAAAKALKLLMDEVKAPELAECFRYHTNAAIDDMIKSVMTCPEINIAIFPKEEGK